MMPPPPRRRAKRIRIWLTSWTILLVVRLLAVTYRIRTEGAAHRSKAAAAHPRGSFCLALWHEHLFAGILAHRRDRFAPLASLSADGDIVAFVMDRFGFKTIRGSSHRGGTEARDDLVRATEDGWFTALTVDGPRGPRRRVKGGVVDVARRTGVVVLPISARADHEWELRSWDRFKIPKPFAKITVRYGEPIAVPPDTQGLAFGAMKAKIKLALDANEAALGGPE